MKEYFLVALCISILTPFWFSVFEIVKKKKEVAILEFYKSDVTNNVLVITIPSVLHMILILVSVTIVSKINIMLMVQPFVWAAIILPPFFILFFLQYRMLKGFYKRYSIMKRPYFHPWVAASITIFRNTATGLVVFWVLFTSSFFQNKQPSEFLEVIQNNIKEHIIDENTYFKRKKDFELINSDIQMSKIKENNAYKTKTVETLLISMPGLIALYSSIVTVDSFIFAKLQKNNFTETDESNNLVTIPFE